ncbi:MAG: arginine deiminase-related protein [Crocinitomicaceae bacterium]|nr:arginine deiminase-related protein [Crocinitomicaceae bacterium]
MKQTTHTLLMIEPTNFGFNEEAFLTNSFQVRPDSDELGTVQEIVAQEFLDFVEQLRAAGVNVLVYSDREKSQTPDSIFPNNWISTHQTGELITYPMAVPNRRGERRNDIITDLIAQHNYKRIDFSDYETLSSPQFLEGTGSMLFDHIGKTVYGAISPRTDLSLLQKLGDTLGYSVVPFTSYGKSGELIYHTNVMLCIGDTYACVGVDTIADSDKSKVIDALKESGKEIIELSNDQVYNHFAGNMLQVENNHGESILVMSSSAYNSLTNEQLTQLKAHNDHLLPAEIPTIERIGGGSARCMLAEIFVSGFDNLNT